MSPEKNAILLMDFCPQILRPTEEVIMAREASTGLEAKKGLVVDRGAPVAHIALYSLTRILLSLFNPRHLERQPGQALVRTLKCHTPLVA